jgi:HK97 family phage major capsid protein
MTAIEARAELKQLYTKADEIERKYPDGLTEAANADDCREVKRLLTEIDGLEEKLEALDESDRRKLRITQGKDLYSRPFRPDLGQQGREREAAARRLVLPGDAFVQSDPYQQHKERGVYYSPSARIEFTVALPNGGALAFYAKAAREGQTKALVYSGSAVGGALVANDLQPTPVGLLQRPLVVGDLLPHVSTESDTIEYIQEAVWTNNAAPVAEATATTGTSGLKPESVLSFVPQTAPVRTIAHWLPVTNRMLADAPAIRGYINTRLLGGLDQAVENQILNGDGTGENLLGILNTPNVQVTGAGSDVLGAMWTARTLIRTNGLANPTAVVINPTNFSQIRLARENTASATLGNYLMGPPSQVGPTTVWGLPVVESLYEPAGTILVGDFDMGSEIFDREQGAIRVGWIDQQFVRNITTILAELRLAFCTFRPQVYCRITGAP